MTFSIQGELTDLNTFVGAMNKNRFNGSRIKKEETERVAWEIKKKPFKPIDTFPVRITYKWYSKDARMDVDNVAFAKKFINDGMVMAGLIPNDGRKQISGFSDEFYIDKDNPRVVVDISLAKTGV